MSVSRQLPALGDVDAEDLRGARGAPHAVDDRPAVGFGAGAVDISGRGGSSLFLREENGSANS